MNKTRVALSALLLAAAWGCEPQPPESCDTIPDQTLNVRQLERLTPCFTDPDGDRLTLAAESSDSTVAAARSLANELVLVRGVDVGDATVTVTATDPDDLHAQTRFSVTVPNRPPELTTPFDTLTVLIGDTLTVGLARHFEDPDGHGLTYEIGSSDTSAVTAAMRGLRLWLSGRTPGPTVVTVIANDGWDSLEADVPITVPVPVRPFRDDFDSDASLDDWMAVRADASIEDGRLLVSPDTALEGYVSRHTGDAPAAADWKIKVSMATADSLGVATVKWQATGSEHTGYYFSIGWPTAAVDSTNWAFGTCISGFPCWTAPGWENQYGWSDEIEVGVLQEFHIWMEGDHAYVRIGEDGPWLMNGVRPGNRHDGVSPQLYGRFELGMFDDDRRGLTAIYDWVELIVN
ncbi:MAG: hypothetical protein OXQ94_13105 [Gemmatimonadota bacterium]|nr:hypothetical protein [Gemmatimonadota bacterium]MDE2872611.1 hypothetical protein [Gemmatimonadota bacterium]